MAIDLNKIIQAAAEAALEGQGSGRQQQSEKVKRKGLTGPRALLLGAGVYTAGRLLVGARGGGLVEQLHDRLADLEDRHRGNDEEEDFEGDEEFDNEPEDEPEGEYDEDEEPEGEYDNEPDDEYDEDGEPEEEDEDEEDAGRPRARHASSAAGRRNGQE